MISCENCILILVVTKLIQICFHTFALFSLTHGHVVSVIHSFYYVYTSMIFLTSSMIFLTGKYFFIVKQQSKEEEMESGLISLIEQVSPVEECFMVSIVKNSPSARYQMQLISFV